MRIRVREVAANLEKMRQKCWRVRQSPMKEPASRFRHCAKTPGSPRQRGATLTSTFAPCACFLFRLMRPNPATSGHGIPNSLLSEFPHGIQLSRAHLGIFPSQAPLLDPRIVRVNITLEQLTSSESLGRTRRSRLLRGEHHPARYLAIVQFLHYLVDLHKRACSNVAADFARSREREHLSDVLARAHG